jgi:hypothetical protein
MNNFSDFLHHFSSSRKKHEMQHLFHKGKVQHVPQHKEKTVQHVPQRKKSRNAALVQNRKCSQKKKTTAHKEEVQHHHQLAPRPPEVERRNPK